MGRKAKVCFPRLSARLSVHKYLCECSVPVTLQNKGNHLLGLSKEKGDCLTQQAAKSPGFPGRCGPSPAFATPEFKDWMQSFVLVFDVGKPKHSILSFVWILSLYYPSWTSHNLKLAALNTFGSCEACKGERKRKCSWMCASVYHSELLALSLITSFYCFFFLVVFLGHHGLNWEEYLLFCGICSASLCDSALPLFPWVVPVCPGAPWVGVQALHEHSVSLNSNGQSGGICFYF